MLKAESALQAREKQLVRLSREQRLANLSVELSNKKRLSLADLQASDPLRLIHWKLMLQMIQQEPCTILVRHAKSIVPYMP